MSSKDGSVAPKERINIKYVPATGDQQANQVCPGVHDALGHIVVIAAEAEGAAAVSFGWWLIAQNVRPQVPRFLTSWWGTEELKYNFYKFLIII